MYCGSVFEGRAPYLIASTPAENISNAFVFPDLSSLISQPFNESCVPFLDELGKRLLAYHLLYISYDLSGDFICKLWASQGLPAGFLGWA